MEIEVAEVPVKKPVEGLSHQVSQKRQPEGNLNR